jgi:hypothetical protein
MMDLPPRARLELYVMRARRLVAEGVPFPFEDVRRSVDADLVAGRRAEAVGALVRAERALEATSEAWAPIRDLLARDEMLREVASGLGLERPRVAGGADSPRALLRGRALDDHLLPQVRAAATASIRAVTADILELGIRESRKLGLRVRAGSQRGEDVGEAAEAFRRLVWTIGARAAVDVGERLAELRRATARIPSPPAYPVPMTNEEQEVYSEARQFARRVHRVKQTTLDAQGAARLITHARADLSEERRAGTPQEEVEQLWGEVARLSREHREAPSPKERPSGGPEGTSPNG